MKVLFYSLEELLFEFVLLFPLFWTWVVMFPPFFYFSILLCFKILRGNVGETSGEGEGWG